MLNLTKPALRDAGPRRPQAHPAARASWPRRWASPPEAIFRGENGLPLEIDATGARFGKREQAGMIFVDGVDVGDIEDVALRDRRMLSADGIFIVVATISEQDGRSVGRPEIIFRGVPFLDEADGLVEELREAVEESLDALGRGGDQRDLPAAEPPPRRPRGVRLQAPEAPADGAARRRRGLAGQHDVAARCTSGRGSGRLSEEHVAPLSSARSPPRSTAKPGRVTPLGSCRRGRSRLAMTAAWQRPAASRSARGHVACRPGAWTSATVSHSGGAAAARDAQAAVRQRARALAEQTGVAPAAAHARRPTCRAGCRRRRCPPRAASAPCRGRTR